MFRILIVFGIIFFILGVFLRINEVHEYKKYENELNSSGIKIVKPSEVDSWSLY